MGVTQSREFGKGAGFSGLRFASVPMKDRYSTPTIPNANPTVLIKPRRFLKPARLIALVLGSKDHKPRFNKPDRTKSPERGTSEDL